MSFEIYFLKELDLNTYSENKGIQLDSSFLLAIMWLIKLFDAYILIDSLT